MSFHFPLNLIVSIHWPVQSVCAGLKYSVCLVRPSAWTPVLHIWSAGAGTPSCRWAQGLRGPNFFVRVFQVFLLLCPHCLVYTKKTEEEGCTSCHLLIVHPALHLLVHQTLNLLYARPCDNFGAVTVSGTGSTLGLYSPVAPRWKEVRRLHSTNASLEVSTRDQMLQGMTSRSWRGGACFAENAAFFSHCENTHPTTET